MNILLSLAKGQKRTVLGIKNFNQGSRDQQGGPLATDAIKTTSVRCAHKTSVCARSKSRLAQSKRATRASFLVGHRWPRAPSVALASPPPPAASRQRLLRGRDVTAGAGDACLRARIRRSVPFERQGCISSLAVIPRFWGALRPAGTPLPNVSAQGAKREARPRTSKPTTRARLVSGYASRQAARLGLHQAVTARCPRRHDRRRVAAHLPGYGSQSKGHCEPVPPDVSDTAAGFGA